MGRLKANPPVLPTVMPELDKVQPNIEKREWIAAVLFDPATRKLDATTRYVLVLATLRCLTAPEGTAQLPVAAIETMSGLDHRSVREATGRLVKSGFLIRLNHRRGDAPVFRFNPFKYGPRPKGLQT